jgi:signal transduction histidine kinase/ligand-binding sensor domain-containing protein/DNA-binding response OmpR family regulator
MYRLQPKIVLIALTLFLPLLVKAQRIRFYSSEHGLHHSLIQRVSQDERGFIWIATANGASRFDGVQFTSYRHEENTPGSLSADLVKIIFTDSRGVTWVGTSLNLQIFDQENNQFRDIQHGNLPVSVSRYVSSITESIDDQKILVSVSGSGVFVYDAITHEFDFETTGQLRSVYNNSFLGNLFFDSKGALWSFSEQGQFSKLNFANKTLDQLNWSDELKEIVQNIVVSAIAEDPVTQNVYIGTYNHGIFIFDRSQNIIRKPKGKSATDYRIRSLCAETIKGNDNELNIWVGTEDSGLKKFSRKNEDIVNPDFQYAPIDLENCKVHSIIQDRQGNIWAGIYQKGLLVIPKSANNFNYIKLNESKGSMSVNIACVTSIVRDNDENLWVGTDGGGLFKIAKNGVKTRYTKDNTPLPNNAVLSLAIDKRGTLWISTYMGGITTFHPNKGFEAYMQEPALQKVYCMFYDSGMDRLFFGTLGSGVKVIALTDNKLHSFPSPDVLGWVNTLLLDSSGALWVGHTGDLRCYVADGATVYNDITANFLGVSVNALFEDDQNDIWVGTSNGLFYFKKKTNEIINYTTTDGLPDNLVVEIEQDHEGNMWLSTSNGLSHFNPETNTFSNYYKYDGLQDNEFRSGAKYKGANGKIYFGGINGITSFRPDEITNNESLMSNIYFSQLTVLNKKVNYNQADGNNILDKHISQASQITLKNNQNVFSLEFAVLEYANPRKVVYGYQLSGFDKEWRFVRSEQPVATYTNLPEGTYVLNVSAFFEGSDDVENTVYNSINIRILPPWYKSWWAYISYLTVFMLLIWEFMNILIRRKLRIKEHREMEKKEMKLRMFTNLSHELRTPFSLIMTPLGSLRETETDPRRKEIFNIMHRNVVRILRLLNQLMDIRKIDNDQFKLKFQRTDMVLFISDLMKSFEQLAIMRSIDFRLVAGHQTLDVWIDQDNFDKVLFNVLSNAFKHTPDNGYIMISLKTLVNDPDNDLSSDINDYVELSIENSGPQIENNEKEQIFERFFQSSNNLVSGGTGIGLHLAKMIVELHGGKIKANNTDNGVIFTMKIPLGKNHIMASDLLENDKQPEQKPVEQDNGKVSKKDAYEGLLSHTNDQADQKNKKSKKTLVFVDDDADLGNYIKLELTDKYNIESFTSVKDAWKVITTKFPDAIITDLMMPEVDGFTLCKKIRQNTETNHIPIVVLTSMNDEESEKLCFENGADHYLRKPINLGLFKSTIAQVIKTRDTMRNKYQSDVKTDFSQVEIKSPDKILIRKVIDTIKQNIENSEFNVDDLSREVGISRVHLNRKLKENMNISPNNLIKSMRIKQAAYLLINNKVNISDVAYKIGFSSHSYFSNSFKEYYGMSPTEFVTNYIDSQDKESIQNMFE